MCGIVAVLPAPTAVRSPDLRSLAGALEASRIPAPTGKACEERTLRHAESTLATTNHLLCSPNAEQQMLTDQHLTTRLRAACTRLEHALNTAEHRLNAIAAALGPGDLELVQQLLVQIADALWTLRHDRLARIDSIGAFLGIDGNDPAIAPFSAVTAYGAIETALRGIDRLEVRGRDSAGLHVWVHAPGMTRLARNAEQEISDRHDPLLADRAVEVTARGLAFTYKTAAVTGQLGDNVRTLRETITGDTLLARALHTPGAQVSVLGHTRWASVGKISEPNAHPVHHAIHGTIDEKRPYAVAVLNGDIDNHEHLRAAEDIDAGPEITTDAKLIPVLLARTADGPDELLPAFADIAATFAGSFAIAAQSEHDPDTLLLAVRGSGQGLYVGFARGAWVVASEPYGLVGNTDRYLRVDGTVGSRDGQEGTLVVLRREGAGDPSGLSRYDIHREPAPLSPHEITRAEITTRDIARGSFPHFLLKELAQAPDSMAKTLRGRIISYGSQRQVRLGKESLPDGVVTALRSGRIERLVFVGQGTAAVACDGIAATARQLLDTRLAATAMPASELSAWHLEQDMSDCLLVAVSQSGTTTDTNRTVDLARAWGAAVVSIVNRRNSDLVAKSDGVLYTSDGRDIEMAVASTKAFYSQIAAGILLILELRSLFFAGDTDVEAGELLAALEELPVAIGKLVNARAQFHTAAREVATRKRHWAVVGSGPNKVAAAEVRIKLSELCYRAVPTDATEDKKHIDLSAEALILVCAAGIEERNADDIAKEIGIFAAHNNTPVVIASERQTRFRGIDHVLVVPETHPTLAWLLSVVAGHLFAYECAAAIDAAGQPLRRALDHLAHSEKELGGLVHDVLPHVEEFLDHAATGVLDGCLSPAHSVQLARLSSTLDIHACRDESDIDVSDLVKGTRLKLAKVLTATIEELTRPIDTVKHQAKTVTVGTTRAERNGGTAP